MLWNSETVLSEDGISLMSYITIVPSLYILNYNWHIAKLPTLGQSYHGMKYPDLAPPPSPTEQFCNHAMQLCTTCIYRAGMAHSGSKLYLARL